MEIDGKMRKTLETMENIGNNRKCRKTTENVGNVGIGTGGNMVHDSVRLFFSFFHDGVEYPCALVHCFSRVGNLPDDRPGMWIVEPDKSDDGELFMSIVHLDTIVRASHLLLVFGQGHVSKTLQFSNTLDTFSRFYVNKYIDHHAFNIAF